MQSTTSPITQGRAILFVAAVGVAASAGSFHATFLSDDWNHIHEAAWSWAGRPFLRPVVDATFWLDRTAFGLENALGFHATNVVLHALNAVLVFLVTRRLIGGEAERERRAPAAALIAGVLFAVLSSHANAVSWIVGRVDVVSAFFALLALWSYLGYRASRDVRTLAFSLAAFLVATFAKESTFALPFALLLYELCLTNRESASERPAGRVRHVVDALLFLVPLGVHLLVRKAWGITSMADQWTGFDAALLLPQAFDHALGGLVPTGVLAWAVPSPGLHASGWAYGVLGGVLAVLVVLDFTRRDGHLVPARAVALAFAFLAMLLPVWQKRVDLIYSDLHSRYTYLPSAFAVVVLALIVHELVRRARLAALPLYALCVALAVVNVVHLHRLNAAWRAAGDTTRAIVDGLAALEPDPRPTLVVGLPDRIGHAYVFRNGFGQAMRQNGVRNTYSVAINWDMVLPADAEANRVEVAREDGALVFTSPFGRWRGLRPRDGMHEVEARGRPSIVLRPLVDARILLWSQGRFERLD